MKVAITFIFLALIAFFHAPAVRAALPGPNWHTGKLVRWDNTILEGELSYNWLMQTVLFRQPDGRIGSFSANQISQFGWFDFTNHKYRDFRVLAHDANMSQTSQAFFEICMDGPLTVVRYLKPLRGLRRHLFAHPGNFSDQPALSENIDSFDYFVYDAGHLRAIDRFHYDVYLPLMTTYKKQLDQYVQVHNINTRTLLGRLVMIDRYNILVEQDAKTASAKGVIPSF